MPLFLSFLDDRGARREIVTQPGDVVQVVAEPADDQTWFGPDPGRTGMACAGDDPPGAASHLDAGAGFPGAAG
jgi:hypothetical protein